MNEKKILLATMALDIGGAETHILELAKGLKKEGYDVIVASNGGIYVKELKKYGIRHVKVPLHNKKPWNVVKSYKILKRIIRDENINIVHAHARIPGFLCGLLSKKFNFYFVTTAHGVFETGRGLKYITNWGEKTLAVSEDIKKYLMENYNIKEENITLTINGIDTKKFSPKVDIENSTEFLEFKNSVNIVHVSRLEEETSSGAYSIIKLVPQLIKYVPNIKIIIVGAGSELTSLKQEADKINKDLNFKRIYVVGSKTNVNEYIQRADIFIGVSRAALEAMSVGKPVILAGNQGYMGIFTDEKFSKAVSNNFTCRGEEFINEKKLKEDIIELLMTYTEQERKVLGKIGRKIVKEYYSIEKMLSDNIKVYKSICKEEKLLNILLFGYIGFGNSGDEAILYSVKTSLLNMNRNINVTVLSNNPKETENNNNVKAVYAFNPIKIIKEVMKNDIIMGSGGSLLQDETSTRSLLYYLSIIYTAKLFNKKVILYANGIGPINKKNNRRLVHKIANKVDLITLREGNSLKLLKELGVVKPKIFVTADPVFNLEGITKKDAILKLKEENIPIDKPIIGVAFRQWEGQDRYIKIMAVVCDEIIEKMNVNVLFITMHKTKDVFVSKKIMSNMNNNAYLLEKEYSCSELIGIIGELKLILSMRLHALVYAGIKNVPMIGFVYDPKVKYYLNLFNMPSAGDIKKVDKDFIIMKVKDILDNYQTYKEDLQKVNDRLSEECKLNVKHLDEFICKNF